MKRTKSIIIAGVLATLLVVLVFAFTGSVNAKPSETTTARQQESGVVPAVPGTFLTGPNEGQPLAIALNFIQENRAALGLSEAEVSNLAISDLYYSQNSAITHIYLIQTHNGIEVYNSIININIAADGSVMNLGNRAIPDLTAAIQDNGVQLSAVDAVVQAAGHLRLALSQTPVVQEVIGGAAQAVVISPSGISQNAIPARLVYQPLADGAVRLAWDLTIYELSGENWWNVRMDAATGQLLDKVNYVDHDNWGYDVNTGQGGALQDTSLNVPLAFSVVPSSYLVYAMPVESPNYAVPAPPADARTIALSPWLDAPTASPLGWHDSGATQWTNTQGNNVDAHKGATRFDCGATLECDPPLDLTMEPTIATNVDAATVNLFYWNNIIHDLTYEYGFDEPAGNFQINNFGMGGAGNDRVNANAQAPGNCNANFSTPPDGSQPTMNMFTCNLASPSRDGDLDNGVIAHEYGHGVSNRLTGGPANVSCLNNAEQMGEGWSDWLGLIMTVEPGDAGTDSRGIGTWLLGQGPNGPGVRNFPYSTNFAINPHTYNDIIGAAIPHGVGEVWATMVWEMVWGLIDEHGYNPDFYDPWNTGGNNLATQLVIDGMKLQPCSPGFVDGRDAILLADQNLTGGANQCIIWEAFAVRGLGFSANQGSSSSTGDGTEAFDIPLFCEFLGANPESIDICVGDVAEYTVTLGNAFVPNVTMAAAGHPAGTTATFSPNPVTTVPSTTTLTIGNTAGATPGNYTITITGTDSTAVSSTYPVDLNVYDAVPGTVTLVSPPDGAINVLRQPTFDWNAATQAGIYLLEVDDNSDFSSIEYSANVAGTTHMAAVSLNSLTTYYWRVTAENTCGSGATSPVWSFTTEEVPPILLVDDDDNNPNVQATYTNALDNLGMDYDIWDTGNSDNEPSFGFMSAYDMIIWFTGDEFGGFAGPSSASEAALGNFLDSGECLFMISQDYHFDRGTTPFMTSYLGVGTITDDNGNYSGVTGQGSIFGGLGPYALTYPFIDYSDRVSPNGTAELAMDGTNGVDAGVNKDSGVYKSIFFGFPWEAINTAAGREEVMQTAIEWCVPLGGVLERNPDLIEETVILGAVVTNSVTISNTGVDPFNFTASTGEAWATVNPPGGTINPGNSMTLDVVFDSGAAGGVGSYAGNLTFNGNYSNSPAPVGLILNVLPQGLGLEVSKTPDVQNIIAGGNADFTISVTNTSVVTISTVTISDPLVPDCDSALTDFAPGASTSYNCTDVGVSGSYTNTVIVTGSIVGGPSGTVMDSAVVNVTNPTGVSLTGLGGDNMNISAGWIVAIAGILIATTLFVLTRRQRQAQKSD